MAERSKEEKAASKKGKGSGRITKAAELLGKEGGKGRARELPKSKLSEIAAMGGHAKAAQKKKASKGDSKAKKGVKTPKSFKKKGES